MGDGVLQARRTPGWTAAAAERSEPSWDVLLLSTAVLLLTAVGRLHMVFPTVGLARPVLLSGALATGLYLLDRHPRRRLSALWSPTAGWLLALILWMALTVPTALREARSFGFLFDDFLKTAVLYGLIVGATRGRRDVERLALVYFAGAAVYATMVLARFEMSPGSWRLSNLYTYDPNDFAIFAVTALPLGLYFLARPGRRTHRFAVLLGCVALSAAFVWAGSRGGFLALLGTLAYIMLRYRSIPLRWRLLGTGLMAAVLVGVASDRYWTEMSTLVDPTGDYNITEETGRLHVWKRGIGYMLDRPLFGVGPDNFPVAEGVLSPLAERQQYGIGVRWTAPHNSLVQVGAELGIPGLIMFLGLIAATFRTLRATGRPNGPALDRDTHAPSLAQALTASLVGFLIGAFFLSLAYAPMLYALIGLAVALRKVSDPGRRPGKHPRRAGEPVTTRPFDRGRGTAAAFRLLGRQQA